MINTNWIIITGCPRSGKTKVIEKLAFLGYKICPETSRIIIDDSISKKLSPNYYSTEFEKYVFAEKLKAELRFHPDECVFWDRSPVDSIAFSNLYCRNQEEYFMSELKYKYKAVFFMCSLSEYIPDYATLENDSESEKLSHILINSYIKLGYNPILVPEMDIESRIEFILRTLQHKLP